MRDVPAVNATCREEHDGGEARHTNADFVRTIPADGKATTGVSSFNDAADCPSQAVSAAGTASSLTGIVPASTTAAGAGNSNGPFGGSMANLRAMISFEYFET